MGKARTSTFLICRQLKGLLPLSGNKSGPLTKPSLIRFYVRFTQFL